MDHRAIEKAADLLWQARLAGRRLAALPADCRPQSLEDGYRIQDSMTARAGKAVVGWKLAATTEGGRRRLGIGAPLAGRLFAGTVLANGARIDAVPMIMRVIEGEFAFRMSRDLPPRARPYEIEEVMAAVENLHLAIEIPDSRFEGFAEIGAPGTLADDAFAAWLVLGAPVSGWRDLDLPARTVRAIRNGRTVGEGRGADSLDPRQALAWLAQDRARRGDGLKAGDIVTTGTRFAPVEILPGDRATVEFIGLGAVEVLFD